MELVCHLSRLHSSLDAEQVVARLHVRVAEDTTTEVLLAQLYRQSSILRRTFADSCRRADQFDRCAEVRPRKELRQRRPLS